MKYPLLFLLIQLILLFVTPHKTRGQSKLDFTQENLSAFPSTTFTSDSLIIHTLDSIHESCNKRTDSLTAVYKRDFCKLDLLQSSLIKELDSLTNRNLSRIQVGEKLHNVTQPQVDLTARFGKRIREIKDLSLSKIAELNLPPDVAERVQAVTENNKITSLTNLPLKTPSLDGFSNTLTNFNGMEELKDPTLLSPSGIADIVGNVDIPEGLADVSQLTKTTMPTGNITDVETLSKVAEEKATDISGIKEIEKQTESLDQYKEAISKPPDQDSLKEMAIAQLRQVAVNHFAGKEQVLQEAMETMTKYKKKYNSVSSISELPKKRPNEMRGKPFIERIVPGLALQIHKEGDDFMVDFNAYAAYRFTRKINGGVGWNQRVAYNLNYNGFNSNLRIFGPRIFGEYNLWKGFSPRVELELMNTNLPRITRGVSSDPLQREWVWGAFVGLKNEYRIIRNIKGTAMIMTRLFNPGNKSPYADVLNVRFGFEFPMKKKSKTVEPVE